VARESAVVTHRTVYCRAIVPKGDGAGLPLEAYLVFRLAIAIQDQLQHFAIFSLGQASNLRMLTKVDPWNLFARLAMGANDRMRQRIRSIKRPLNAARRGDVGGPFGSLPLLEWGDYVIAQTLPVAGYLGHRLGHMRDRAPEERFFLDMISSAAHLDMQAPYTQLLWLPADERCERIASVARSLFDALTRKLAQLDSLLQRAPGEMPFFGGAAPVMADYFVYESITRAVATFGAGFVEAVQGPRGWQGLLKPCRIVQRLPNTRRAAVCRMPSPQARVKRCCDHSCSSSAYVRRARSDQLTQRATCVRAARIRAAQRTLQRVA